MTSKFKVFYAAVPAYRIQFHVPMPFSVESLPVTHRHVLDLDAESRDAVYLAMQGENWSPNGEAMDLLISLGLNHTSMSVGDVVRDDEGVYWMCDSFGWSRVPDTLEPAEQDSLANELEAELGSLFRRGAPFSPAESKMGGRLTAWRNALKEAA